MKAKKAKVFRQYMDKELGKHKTMRQTFQAANNQFEKDKGLSGYSCYESFLNSWRNTRND